MKTTRQTQPDHRATSFAALRGHIYPMLKPIELLAAVQERGLPMLAYQLFLADVMVTYVIDAADNLTYINEQHIERWQVDLAAVHTQALGNLRRRSLGLDYTSVGEGASQLFISNQQDGYDATRLLIPELLVRWRGALPGQMILGIPSRDFLVAFSNANPDIFTRVAHQIQLDAAQQPAGITDQLFTLIDDTVCEYTWQ